MDSGRKPSRPQYFIYYTIKVRSVNALGQTSSVLLIRHKIFSLHLCKIHRILFAFSVSKIFLSAFVKSARSKRSGRRSKVRCKDCCRDAVSAMGCDHDDWCFSDSDFEDHLKAEHSGAGHTHIASATWEADGARHWHPCRYCDDKKLNAANHEFDAKGVCKVCGYIYEGDVLPDDFICPLCKHGAEDFEKLPE